MHFLNHISRLSSSQYPHEARDYYIGWRRYKTSLSSQKVLLDTAALIHTQISFFQSFFTGNGMVVLPRST